MSDADRQEQRTTVPGAIAGEGRKPPGLEEISSTLANMSVDIQQTQDALVAAKVRAIPYEPAIRQAECLMAAALFLDRLKPHMAEIRRMMAPRQVKDGFAKGGSK